MKYQSVYHAMRKDEGQKTEVNETFFHPKFLN